MLQLITLLLVPFIVYFGVQRIKGMNSKAICLRFLSLFAQAIIFLIGRLFYCCCIGCNRLFNYIESLSFDASTATVATIRDTLKIPHNQAYKIYQKYNKKDSKNNLKIITNPDDSPIQNEIG